MQIVLGLGVAALIFQEHEEFEVQGSDMDVMPPDGITLWTLKGEGAHLLCFKKVDIGGVSTLHALQVALELIMH